MYENFVATYDLAAGDKAINREKIKDLLKKEKEAHDAAVKANKGKPLPGDVVITTVQLKDIKDAAKGMGMRGPGVLLKAEIPVAMPLILLGLRTAAIQVVATATIAAYAGIGGLGRYIVDGLSRKDYPSVIGGSVLVVLLAVAVQLLFVLIRRAFVSQGLRGSSRTS